MIFITTISVFHDEFLVAGEITFKLHSKWDENLLNENSATFKILEGNVRKAVRNYNLYYKLLKFLCHSSLYDHIWVGEKRNRTAYF